MKAKEIFFSKYHGTGNDFILIDDRKRKFNTTTALIRKICDRHFGIGADGLILIRNHSDFDFEMVYYNADGKIGSMCGNGGRCAVIFANKLGMIKSETTFQAYDGIHRGLLLKESVKLSMADVKMPVRRESDFVADTGSPHLVRFVRSLNSLNVFEEGRKIRYSSPFKRKGINVNFAEETGRGIQMRTYERGVENETLSCGTGTVAVAVAAALKNNSNQKVWRIDSPGGKLKVYLERKDNSFTDVWLEGEAVEVFSGRLKVSDTF